MDQQDGVFLINRIRALEARLAHERRGRAELFLDAERHAVIVAENAFQLTRLESRIQDLQRELEHVYSGRSWRLTSPLRLMLRVVRRRRESECSAEGSAIAEALGFEQDSKRVAELAALINEEIPLKKVDST